MELLNKKTGGESVFILIDIDSKGYGKIYKSVMRDRSLSLLAKQFMPIFAPMPGVVVKPSLSGKRSSMTCKPTKIPSPST